MSCLSPGSRRRIYVHLPEHVSILTPSSRMRPAHCAGFDRNPCESMAWSEALVGSEGQALLFGRYAGWHLEVVNLADHSQLFQSPGDQRSVALAGVSLAAEQRDLLAGRQLPQFVQRFSLSRQMCQVAAPQRGEVVGQLVVLPDGRRRAQRPQVPVPTAACPERLAQRGL